MIRIASFDIGKKNFAHYVEDVSESTIDSLKAEYLKLKVKERKVDNLPVQNIIQQLCLDSVMISTGVFDLRETEENVLDIPTRRNVINHLEKYKELWNSCSVVVIEQQFFNVFTGFKARKPKASCGANVDAIKIGEIVMTWFLLTFSDKIDAGEMEVVSFGSQFKTQTLGAPKKLDKPARKTWSVERTEKLYHDRNDELMIALFNFRSRWARKRPKEEAIIKALNDFKKDVENYSSRDKQAIASVVYLAERIIRERQKLDDISDTCLQCQAYKYSRWIAS